MLNGNDNSHKLNIEGRLDPKERRKTTNKLSHTPSTDPTQATRPEEPIAAPSVLTLIHLAKGKLHKTWVGFETFPNLELMPKNFKITKSNISLYTNLLEELPDILM